MRFTIRKTGGGQLEASLDLTGSESRQLAETLDELDGKPIEIRVNTDFRHDTLTIPLIGELSLIDHVKMLWYFAIVCVICFSSIAFALISMGLLGGR